MNYIKCGLAQGTHLDHPSPSSRIKHFLERIANDVLSLSRIQLQVLTIQQIEFDVIEEVNQLTGVFKNELKMYG